MGTSTARRFLGRYYGRVGHVLLAPLTFSILWYWLAPRYYLPSIWQIINALGEMISAGTYLHDIFVSTTRGIGGFFLGAATGSLLGILTGRYSRIFLLFGGMLLLLRWTPVLALLPITLRIGGIGEGPKVFLIAWACFFVSWAYMHAAVSRLDRSYIWWADSLGLTTRQRILEVYAPAVSPSLIGGARVSLALAMIVVVAAELGGTLQSGFFREGLGYRISRAIETNRNDINIACILTLGGVGLILDFLLVVFVSRGLRRLTRIDFYRNSA